MSLFRRAILGAACLLLLSRPLAATIYVADTDQTLFGKLDQHNTNMIEQFGIWGCGPTAVTNSLVYLQNGWPGVYNYTLVPMVDPNHPTQGEMAAVAQMLGGVNYMNSTQANGTFWDLLIYGTQLYIEQTDPNMTIYGAESEHLWGGHALNPKPAWVQDGMANGPTVDYLYQKILDWHDVEVLLENGDKGHYLTATGITFDTDTNLGFLRYIDPWDGTYKSSNMQRLVNGQLQVNYGGVWQDLTVAFDESPCVDCPPVPEPGTWALLLGGLAFVAVRRQARDLAV